MLAIVSIVLGVFGLMFSCLPVCGIPLAIVGLVLGGMGRSTKLRGWAYGGMALNALSILIGLLMTAAIVLMFVFSPTSTITN